MRLVTNGLGGGQQSGLVLQGMTFESVARGGRSLAKDIYNNFLEEFTIAVKLLEINGKELVAPIFNRRKYTIDESIDHKVKIEKLSIQKREIDSTTSVFAKIIKINRGSDGED
jgi:hypothetical protein